MIEPCALVCHCVLPFDYHSVTGAPYLLKIRSGGVCKEFARIGFQVVPMQNKLTRRSRNSHGGVPDDQSVQAMRCGTQALALVTPKIGSGYLRRHKLADDNHFDGEREKRAWP